MTLSKLNLLNNTALSDQHTAFTSRYKASIAAVSPDTEREQLGRYSRCFVGISLDNQNFKDGRLQAIIDWVSERFDSCIFLVADYIHRHTLNIRNGFDSKTSEQKALTLGDAFIRTNALLFNNVINGCQFKPVRGSDIYRDSRVMGYHQDLLRLYNADATFKASIDNFANVFILRQKKNADTETTKHHMHLSRSYILEELAYIAYMNNLGCRVLVYPGSIKVSEEISNGQHTNVPDVLKSSITVGLKLKCRGKRQRPIPQEVLQF
ncbi:MAG: tRNA-dependent cyclodipeptide synthase [Pseudomonadales bacterium]